MLQAILYGSLRYWLFSLVMPSEVHDALEEDAYQIMWAEKPEIFSDEDGSSAATRAYIRREATYLPQKEGGAGIMHFRAHAEAFYAHWIRRYLEPGEAPWKRVVDRWILPCCLGLGMWLG